MHRIGALIFRAGLGAIALVFAGCASITPGPYIPLPRVTPFDQNHMARAAYLDSYQDGYRAALGGRHRSMTVLFGPYSFAREMGWNAGTARARADHQ